MHSSASKISAREALIEQPTYNCTAHQKEADIWKSTKRCYCFCKVDDEDNNDNMILLDRICQHPYNLNSIETWHNTVFRPQSSLLLTVFLVVETEFLE